jgi:outer membrane protein assembly factor BamD (BamD/ComL family)
MKYSVLLFTIAFLLSSCAGSGERSDKKDIDLDASIKKLENELYSSDQTKFDRQKAGLLIDLYTEYADTYPDDTAAPAYLYKASDLSMNLRQPVETIALFNRILDKYPDYEKSPTVLFLKAFVYEDQMNDLNRARQYYELFLEKYPNNEFADDAKVSLKNLGKTPEQLIKEFEGVKE